MRTTKRLVATSFAVLLLGASAQADEADCVAARYKAAGQYVRCEAKAAAKEFHGAAFLKCRQKYADAWTELGAKYHETSCDGARFVDNGLTITDNLTQLVWEKKTTDVGSGVNAADRHDVDNIYSWSAVSPNADGPAFTDFLDDLNSTGFAGQHDWRLPTIFELHSIVATDALLCAAAPCVADPTFSPTQSDHYWSSSTYQDGPSNAWGVSFNFSITDVDTKTFNTYVRAVRAGF